MFQLFGPKRNRAQDERANTAKVSNEKTRGRLSESSSSSQGPLQRPALVQQQQHNTENMVTLHARLLQEAEKIRKWKVQTELELKEKERKLAEALLRIETMKKSILELQLQNERTSAKLEEEITNKGEVIQRIDATREMCNLLKSHASNVIDRLTRCETEKTELKYTNKEQNKQFQELTEKFKNLKIQVTENTKNSKSHAEKDKLDQMQKEENLKKKLHTSENQILNLQDLLRKKNEEIQSLEVLKQSQVLKIETLELSANELQKNVSCLSKDLETREAELKDSALRIAKVQDEKGNLEKTIQILEVDMSSLQTSKDNLTLQMTENTKDLENQLQLAKDDAKIAKKNLEVEQMKLSLCEKQLHEATSALESLKSARDVLLMDKKDAEINEDMLKFQINNLLAEKEESKEEIHNLNGEISVLNKKLDRENLCKVQVQDESEALQNKITALELLRNENEDHIISLQKELSVLQTKAESLETLLSTKADEVSQLQERNETLEQTVATERQKVDNLEAHIKGSEMSLMEKAGALQQSKENLDSVTKTFEALVVEKEELEHKLTASDAQRDELRNSLEDREKKIQELKDQLDNLTEQKKESGKSLTAQQKKTANTAKLNKELEKEVKGLKTKLEKKTNDLKQQSDEIIAVQTEMAVLREAKADAEASMQTYKEEMENLKTCCERDQREARLAMEKAMEMQLSAEKEKENAQALTDCQLTEMMSTLETYKQNNEKLISEKDLKIDELKMQIEDQKSAAVKHDEDKFEWNCEIETLKNQMTSCEKEKDKLTKEVTALSTQKDELKKQVVLLENQMSDMKFQVVQTTQEMHTPVIRNEAYQSPHIVKVTPQKQQAPFTPLPVTPKISTVPKTPSRSILRVVNSESKRRKVAFAASKSPASSSDECDLMEFDPDASLCKRDGTPLLFTPTYKGDKNLTSEAKPLTRKPRGPQIAQTKYLHQRAPGDAVVSRTPIQTRIDENPHEPEAKRPDVMRTPKIRTAPTKEVKTKTRDSVPETAKPECLKTANIRKTPAKKSKFFSVSPRNKKGTSASKEKVNDGSKDSTKLAWFDLDSVYGFGPED